MEHKYTAIILGKYDVGETDRIYIIYTLEQGKIRALAKGVRRAEAKLPGFLENFTFAGITVAKNRGMGKITSSIVENPFSSLRRNYDALLKVFSTVNIFNKLVTDFEHKDEDVFNILKEYLEAVDSQSLFFLETEKDEFEKKLDLLTTVFVLKLLNYSGYGSEINCCSQCGDQIEKENLHFSAKSGGIICNKCLGETGSQLKLSSNAVKLMRIALVNSIKSFNKIKVDKGDINLVKIAISEILGWI